MSSRGKRVVKIDLMSIVSISRKTYGAYMYVIDAKVKSWSPWVTALSGRQEM